MSEARPSRAQREAWAELLGEPRRPSAARWPVRIVVVAALALVVAIPLALANQAGYLGCPSSADTTSFFAKSAEQVSEDDRDVMIRRVLRCVDFEGMTRAQVGSRLGEWTPVSLYPEAAKARKGQLLVWSNGDTSGVGVWFTGPHGHAFLAERYDP